MRLSETATKYIGQRELPNNRFDPATDFGKKIKAVGHHDGDSWCSYFVELCLKETYPERFSEFEKLCSANANQTFKNFKDAAHIQGELPAIDWVVVWVLMKDGKEVLAAPGIKKGHIGICSSVNINDKFSFESIEGNTGDSTGREGDVVARKFHRVNNQVTNGLKVVGFFKP